MQRRRVKEKAMEECLYNENLHVTDFFAPIDYDEFD